eukprot:CAMPEP_0119041686 /NCGR_PEP_ID=MMETSP1177-20130426/12970_1 /TAXON_ID=2985 /ORGANISM="Ochromonas sp, Strain CCMP1899" /LENGTH=221 /DNA_ID=CAMNT_0007007921 /DNA_START=73 /DNA_END=738 /DNA_ORIENTATION=+
MMSTNCYIAVLMIAFAYSSLAFNIQTSQRAMSIKRELVMKGKGGKIPINQRGEYLKQQRMMESKNQMEQEKPDGVPVFKVYVRPKVGGLWIPCGDLAGDKRATSLVNAWMSGFLVDLYRGQLDQGIARSIFTQEDSFAGNIIDNYKPFRKYTKDDLQFGYKIAFEGLEEKMGEQKITPITKGMEKGWLDVAKEGFSKIISGDAMKATGLGGPRTAEDGVAE